MKNFVQDGGVYDYTNTTGAMILAGQTVLMTDRFGVAAVDIPNGMVGAVADKGVFKMVKVAGEAFTQGQKIYWDTVNKRVTSTAGALKAIGYAFVAAASADTVAKVQLAPL